MIKIPDANSWLLCEASYMFTYVYLPATYWRYSCAGVTGRSGEAPSIKSTFLRVPPRKQDQNEWPKASQRALVYIVAHGDLLTVTGGIRIGPDLPWIWFGLHVPSPLNRVSLSTHVCHSCMSSGLMGKVALEPTTSGQP